MFSIKILSPDDADLLRTVAPSVFDHSVAPELLQEFLADARHHLAVAIDDGQVVGIVSAVHYVHPDKRPQLFINEVAVSGPYRQKGIGRALMSAMLERGKNLGCTEAWVLTDRKNTAAMRFYGGLGGSEAPSDSVMFTFRLADDPH